jgi:hypothetical protein
MSLFDVDMEGKLSYGGISFQAQMHAGTMFYFKGT